jgi:hypothetical protein
MADYVLWKRLTRTDFNSMHGLASPSGSGGGARHIALGVATEQFPIDQFLKVSEQTGVTVQVDSTGFGPGQLRFVSIPRRRYGEWMIADQRTHRHPAWSTAAGFPTKYDPSNAPVILVFRVGSNFYARLSNFRQLSSLRSELPAGPIGKGIAPVTDTLLSHFDIAPAPILSSFEEYLSDEPLEPFDPRTIEDARQRLFAAITRRQGQGPFRNALLSAYSGRCAMTRTRTLWVLEAAHIVPYRGRKTNVLQNGLLLRADVHTLFDLGLISIEPSKRRIVVSSLIRRSFYAALHERPILQPRLISARPSSEAIAQHYSRFRE